MGEKNPEIKGRPDPTEVKPVEKPVPKPEVAKALGRTAIRGR